MSALLGGRELVEVAALFKVSVKAVDNWWAKRRAGGRDALLSRPRGRRVGEHQVLSEAEQAAVRRAVLDQISSDLGLSVADQVRIRRTGNRFSVNAMSAISTRICRAFLRTRP
ncbi:helix-turn-helix domain-containing protein [Streptomyces sp. AB3(2024)]|uniref:helix-turn-helix domain-containing protein n=1 Tax=Streptomyces sp. AB3(2024) TaxID=3317321 RepID=UPI0035A3695A